MKILESQNGVLSNYEVYQHLVDHQQNLKDKKRRGPGNLATLVKEVCRSHNRIYKTSKSLTIREKILAYLRTSPSPLQNQEQTRNYDYDVVSRLLQGMQSANLNQDLAKGEVLMILNLRPSSIAVLSTVIEDMEERFSDDEQNAILEVIASVLGRHETANGEGSTAMESVENGA